MDVCYLINQLAPGGAPTLLLDVVRTVDDPDVSFTVCMIEGDTSLVPEFETHGARVVDFGATFKFDPRAIARLVRFLRQEEFDVLHAHLPYAQTLGRVFGRLAGIETIVSTQHNVPGNYHPITRTLERLTRGLDDRTIAVSEGVERAFTGSAHPYPASDSQWCTIYNGIDVRDFREHVEDADSEGVRERWGVDADLVYLNVARYVPAKAQHDLVVAMNELAARAPEAHLFVVGWGEREEELGTLVRTHGLEESVTITGRVSEVFPYYAVADVFVSSSTFEGLPITHIEAMSAGLPLVATDIPGVNEVVVDGETGILVPPGDPAALSEAMGRLRDENRRTEYGRQGFERARDRFSIEQTVTDHLALYRELAGSC